MDGAFFPPPLFPARSVTAAYHHGRPVGGATLRRRPPQPAKQQHAATPPAVTDPASVASGHRRPTVLAVQVAATPPSGDGRTPALPQPPPPPTHAPAAVPPGGATGATVLRLLVAVAPLFRDPPPVGGGGGDTAAGAGSSGGDGGGDSGDGGSRGGDGSRRAGRGGVVDKVDGTPVTATDYAVQAVVAAWLPQGEALLAEEGVEGWDAAPPDVRAAAVAAFTRVVGGGATRNCGDGGDTGGGGGGGMAVAGAAAPPPNLRSLLGVGGVAWMPHPATTPAAATAAAVAAANTNGGDRLWVVDPIDGTAGYVGGRGRYALGIGVLDERGVAAAGLLLGGGEEGEEGAAAPPNGGLRLAVAARGEGVGWYTLDGDVAVDGGGTPLGWGLEPRSPTTPAAADPAQAMTAATAAVVRVGGGVPPPLPWTASGAAPPGATLRLLASRGGTPPVRLCCGSLVKYAAVAAGVVGRAVIWAGRGDGGGTVALWDHVAGVGVVEASGGRVTALGRADAAWTTDAVGREGRVYVGDAVAVTAAGVDHAAWVAEVHAALVGEA